MENISNYSSQLTEVAMPTVADFNNARYIQFGGGKISGFFNNLKTKIAALTEAGYQVTATKAPIAGWFSNYVYSALTNNNIEIAFVMFWGNGKNDYYVPVPSTSNASDFIDFTNKSKALLINEIPNMYVIPN